VNGVYRNVANVFSEVNTFNNNVVINSDLNIIDNRSWGTVQISQPTDNLETAIGFFRYKNKETLNAGDAWLAGMSLWGYLASFVIGTASIGPCFKIDTSGNTQIIKDLNVSGHINNSDISAISTNATNTLQGYNSIINILKTVYFTYPLNNGGATQYYKIGTLNLPQGGHQAEIKVNLCYGFNITESGINATKFKIQNYQLSINIYSSNGYRLPNPTIFQIPYLGSSRSEDSNSYINGTLPSLYGIFYSGFVNVISPFTNPLGVFMGTTADPLNKVDIWIQS